MTEKRIRSTIHFEPGLHEALRMKAKRSGRSMSAIANDAVRVILAEDEYDLKVFEDRAFVPEISYERLLAMLRSDGKL